MLQIKNPVLPGFNADPSIIRVDDTYYIANSTFEWFPGVRLHESKDLVHWNLLPSALSTTTLLDMKGNPSSGGIWAPDLSYADGKFWLIYTDVKVTEGPFKDMINYLTTAEDIRGPWSIRSVSMVWDLTHHCSMMMTDANTLFSRHGIIANTTMLLTVLQ